MLKNNYLYGGNYDGYINFNAYVDKITEADFKQLAEKYFNDNNRFEFKLVPEK